MVVMRGIKVILTMAISKYNYFVQKLDQKLSEQHYKVWRQTHVSADREIALFATRIRWSLVRVPVHICVDYVSEPKKEDFIKLFEDGIAYSKRAYSKGPLVWVSSFAMVPVIACDMAYQDLIDYVQERHLLWKHHLKNWTHGFHYYPVLVNLSANEVYYWTGYTYTGSAVWPFSRQVIKEAILPAAGIRI